IEIPVPLSTRPAATGSRCFTSSVALNGESAAFVRESGPAVPLSFSDPPPGRFADSSNGNEFAKENCFIFRFTFEYMNGLPVAGMDETIALPFWIANSPTLKFGIAAGCCPDFESEDAPPRLEKFQTPLPFWTS